MPPANGSSSGSVLVTDDDADIRRVLTRTLLTLGFDAAEASNGEEALREVEARPFDVVLLDVNMPGMGGIEACRQIRKKAPRLQILMLTVREREEDKVKALDAGADDYVTKPFSMPELAARIRAAVRRTSTPPVDTNAPIVIGEIELDPERRSVSKAGTALRLTNKEFDLLHYLMSHPGVPLAHAKLLRAVWGAEYGQELEYLRVFMHQLRKKLEDDPSAPEYLLTELHFGYRFREPADDKSVSTP